MKQIAIVTATRAEYGILTPLIRAVEKDPELELSLLVTGTHISHKHGYTVCQIEADGFPIAARIPILEEGNSAYDISVTMANALKGFAAYFRENHPDCLVILGDRTEMLAIAAAAMNERIPIVHIHGGEVTKGAVDDSVRHALTKMSYLHFTAAQPYSDRVVQMGEAPVRVFCVGALSSENILHAPLMEESDLRKDVGIPADKPYVVVTFHPVTLEGCAGEQTRALCQAMTQRPGYFYLITMANADAGGDEVNAILAQFLQSGGQGRMVANLGMIRYLSAVKHAAFVLGNSSSGILEAPVLGTPTVNVGSRQDGRLRAPSVLDCSTDPEAITETMDRAEAMPHHPTAMFGMGDTSSRMLSVIKEVLLQRHVDLKKGFYDINQL